MGDLLKDKPGGQMSSGRLSFIVNTIAAIGIAAYIVYMDRLSWEAVGMVSAFLGVTNFAKLKAKSLENGGGTTINNVSR